MVGGAAVVAGVAVVGGLVGAAVVGVAVVGAAVVGGVVVVGSAVGGAAVVGAVDDVGSGSGAAGTSGRIGVELDEPDAVSVVVCTEADDPLAVRLSSSGSPTTAPTMPSTKTTMQRNTTPTIGYRSPFRSYHGVGRWVKGWCQVWGGCSY